jgi:hypothetical protein
MERDVLMFAQVMTVIVMSVGAFVAIGLGARVLWRMGSRAKPGVRSAVDDGRMERLESAVDAIAIEVERISESQRFAVGLLADRLPARGDRVAELASSASTKRANTPH